MANQQTRQLRKLSSKDPRNMNLACVVTSSSSGTRHNVEIVNRSHGFKAFKFIGNPDKSSGNPNTKRHHPRY